MREEAIPPIFHLNPKASAIPGDSSVAKPSAGCTRKKAIVGRKEAVEATRSHNTSTITVNVKHLNAIVEDDLEVDFNDLEIGSNE